MRPLAVVALALVHGLPVQAQGDAAEPLSLRPSPLLRPDAPAQAGGQLPTFVSGDRLSGRTDLETLVEGNAQLRKGDTLIRADRLEYYQPDDLARARGQVHVNRAGNTFDGTLLELKVDAFEGFFNEPRYRFLQSGAHGQADRVDFVDDQRMVIRNATYTTCQREDYPGWVPDWILQADTIRLDQEAGSGEARGALLTFKGIPVLPVPALNFPLGDARKSGLLPPTIGLDTLNGFEFKQPYYWNIAPNRDLTLSPTLMAKRGVDLGAEFRYLEAPYSGEVRLNYLPDDKLRAESRWGLNSRHAGVLGRLGDGNVNLSLNVNRVSDDNYWRDFSRASSLTQRLLATDGLVNWAQGPWYAQVRTLKWQTLQQSTSIIVPPYDRLPQVMGRYSRPDLPLGFDGSVEIDTTRFQSDARLTGQPNAHRSFALARLERPFQTPGFFFTPRVQLHSTQYTFDRALATGETSASRSLPIYSLDSGLVFEREASYFGRGFTQTLEPRAFYVYTPYRDQSRLPNYDSGLNDFNFATVFTENAFGGNDRIADNNLLTLGATSRLLEPQTGAEAARFGVAQRVRFKDQRVTLSGGAPVSERVSDILFGATLNLAPQWSFDSTVQYNQKTDRSERITLGGRYNPGSYRVISAAYRLQRRLSEQVDVGWQWPLSDLWGGHRPKAAGEGRWYSVGRLNFSMVDRRLVDTIVGFEYDACCWIGRIVLERLQATTTSSNKRILFQLEFIGFSRLGSNPLTTLRNNIPRYQMLRSSTEPSPSRFSNYD